MAMAVRLAGVTLVALAMGALLGCGGGSTAGPVSGTPAWKTYHNELGFSMRYPPAWKVETYEDGLVKILNEKRQQQTAAEGGDSGEAWVEIGQDAIPSFDTEALRTSCESGSSGAATDVTLAGRRAVRCMWPEDGTDVYTGLPLWGLVNWVEFPPGHALSFVTYALDTDEATHQMLDEIIATTTFETES